MVYQKLLPICILFFCNPSLYAQTQTLSGKITNDLGQPVDSCLVQLSGCAYATYSNAKGEFLIDYAIRPLDSLTFSHIAYQTKRIPAGSDVSWVILRYYVNTLADAVVEAEHYGGKIKKGILGKKNLKAAGIAGSTKGDQQAIFLPADPGQRGILSEVFFYITKTGVPSSRFRIHIYSADTTGLPGRDLLDSTIIIHATTGNEWVAADVSSRRIPIRKGIFIAMEWLSGTGQNPNVITGADIGYTYNTQVLGMTRGYHRYGSLNFFRGANNTKWYSSTLNPARYERFLNPMIYATYTYYQK